MANIEQSVLNSLNVAQGKLSNKEYLESIGGVDELIRKIGVDVTRGLSAEQLIYNRRKFGENVMPVSPRTSFITLFIRALSDTTLLILLAAASVSFGIGMRYNSYLTAHHHDAH